MYLKQEETRSPDEAGIQEANKPGRLPTLVRWKDSNTEQLDSHGYTGRNICIVDF